MNTEKALVLDSTQRLPWSVRVLLPLFESIEAGSLSVELADGRKLLFRGEQDGPAGDLRLRHPGRLLARLVSNASMGLAQSYIRGEWSSARLAETLQLFARNQGPMTGGFGGRRLFEALDRLQHRLRRNDRRGSRRNIRQHYDLGNNFYRLWLDAGMTYSGARFTDEADSLEQAQALKYESLLHALHARPGDHILEIGCGWGGFAEFAARRGYQVTGITLSKAQYDYARARIKRAGLEFRVDLRLQDYRDLRGQFDHIVSIEMFEAVGTEYWPAFFDRLKACLRPGGRASLQVITIAPAHYRRYARRADFIQKYIFPGGMLPSVPAFTALAHRRGFQIAQCGFHGEDYARTLRHWEHRFLLAHNSVREQGFDHRFIRLWQYYLAYCQAGFLEGRIDLMQTTLIKPLADG